MVAPKASEMKRMPTEPKGCPRHPWTIFPAYTASGKLEEFDSLLINEMARSLIWSAVLML
jgi:hypothetical protein